MNIKPVARSNLDKRGQHVAICSPQNPSFLVNLHEYSKSWRATWSLEIEKITTFLEAQVYSIVEWRRSNSCSFQRPRESQVRLFQDRATQKVFSFPTPNPSAHSKAICNRFSPRAGRWHNFDSVSAAGILLSLRQHSNQGLDLVSQNWRACA